MSSAPKKRYVDDGGGQGVEQQKGERKGKAERISRPGSHSAPAQSLWTGRVEQKGAVMADKRI